MCCHSLAFLTSVKMESDQNINTIERYAQDLSYTSISAYILLSQPLLISLRSQFKIVGLSFLLRVVPPYYQNFSGYQQ